MPKNKKEARSCHDCGLEDTITCEEFEVHQSSMPDELPCRVCLRNPEQVGWYDFWDEQWTMEVSKGGKQTVFLEDVDDTKRVLVERLAELRGGEKCVTP